MIGIAVATSYYKGYFPIAHEGGGNMDKAKVLSWLKDVLDAPSTKIFHNAIYDVCWLRAMGFKINGDIVCTMLACRQSQMKIDLDMILIVYPGII